MIELVLDFGFFYVLNSYVYSLYNMLLHSYAYNYNEIK